MNTFQHLISIEDLYHNLKNESVKSNIHGFNILNIIVDIHIFLIKH